jgi:Leucine-rich repeat (LRR) protein
MAKDLKDIDLEDMGVSLLDNVPLSDNLETLNLFNNEIDNPGQVTSRLMELPNLKALWLNGNPVVSTCANFNTIGEYFPAL